MAAPEVKTNVVESVWIRQLHFLNAGDILLGNIFTHNHTTIIAKGSFLVTVNGQETEIVAPNLLYINKDIKHDLKALENNSVLYNVHALRDNDTGDIVDASTIVNGSIVESMVERLG